MKASRREIGGRRENRELKTKIKIKISLVQIQHTLDQILALKGREEGSAEMWCCPRAIHMLGDGNDRSHIYIASEEYVDFTGAF